VWIAVLLFSSFNYTQATAHCRWNVMFIDCAHYRLASPLNLQTSKYFCIHCCPISGRFPGGTRLSFWYGQYVDENEYLALVDTGRGKTAVLGENPDLVPLCLPQISRGLTWDRNWASKFNLYIFKGSVVPHSKQSPLWKPICSCYVRKLQLSVRITTRNI
jgi:hypothetical protein